MMGGGYGMNGDGDGVNDGRRGGLLKWLYYCPFQSPEGIKLPRLAHAVILFVFAGEMLMHMSFVMPSFYCQNQMVWMIPEQQVLQHVQCRDF